MEIGTSRDGIMRAQQQMDRASASLVEKTQMQEEDITKDVVDQKEAEIGVEMNVRMAKTQDNMVGTLLDMVA